MALIGSLVLFADNETKLTKIDSRTLLVEGFINTFIRAFSDTSLLPPLEDFKYNVTNLDDMKYLYKLEYINNDIDRLKRYFEYDANIGSMVLDVTPILMKDFKSENYFYVPIKYYLDYLDYIPTSYEDIRYGVTTKKVKYFEFIMLSENNVKRKIRFFVNNFNDLIIDEVLITTPMLGIK